MMARQVILLSLPLFLYDSPAAHAANNPTELSTPEGQDLAAELRSSRPAENLKVNGVLRIRDDNGKRTIIPFHFQIIVDTAGWRSIYETNPTGAIPGERLVIVHAKDDPNRYVLSRSRVTNATAAGPLTVSGSKAMVPFANSDFWLADLGLEFLHWPEQRIVTDAKIKMRKGRPCKVLESTNPVRDAPGYTRVRSWVDVKTGGVILAEAFGPDNRLVKEFEIGGLTKVNGQWELKDMEMRDARTNSQTVLEFKYEQPVGEW